MGILNPFLAILPLLNQGEGKDSNCAALILRRLFRPICCIRRDRKASLLRDQLAELRRRHERRPHCRASPPQK